MTALKRRIADLIRESGPIPLSQYMALCLFDPADGYYTTREPFGVNGDFTTAPEISQMFGELIGAWLVAVWRQDGEPADALLAEIGPGRGTLMKDVLRTVAKLAPALAARPCLIETSPRLSEIQRSTLGQTSAHAAWFTRLEDLPPAPLYLVGNELFDAIPISQFIKINGAWRERRIGLDQADELTFVSGAPLGATLALPAAAQTAPDQSIIEMAPTRAALMRTAADHIARHGGAALFLDYGHLKSDLGDTLQALRRHAYDDPLAHPGEADLTSHVDFQALAETVREARLKPHLAAQGEFLISLGLLERAGALGALGAGADDETRKRIVSQAERLAGPDQMGELFKVIGFSAAGRTLPGF